MTLRAPRMAAWVGTAALLASVLCACHRPPPAAPDVTLLPQPAQPPLLRVTPGRATLQARDVPTGTPWRIRCDSATGPFTRDGRAGGGPLDQTLHLPGGVYGCTGQVGSARVTAGPATPGAALPRPPRPAPVAALAAAARGTVTVMPATVRIGQREPWVVRAAVLDASGAPVPDGTLVTLTGRGPAGAEVVAERVTVNGEAQWALTPDQPGTWTLNVRAGPWHAALRASARSALLGGTPPALWGGDTLKVGPLTWDDGALPDDGTPVEVTALDARGRSVWATQGFTVLGRVEVDIPRLSSARTLQLAVAGTTATLPWEQP
ncbi:hypothetical protein HNQ07_002405 [Deinococcus metalli]|uniref:Carboxypeptidase regulatory-like domain-containing protein n=1 Tax=Deinococcus metalli TaxID=1141878 RepID=A0A7W8NPM7_9DEIO|nr:hypothetical protein [Deinococcus metalli]MBB5376941.1 hypothetical protein [Deinococcus metalli]GHF46463.1 hypothetical protein GCM10017781_23680 [Deinococcus metalli]